MDKSDEGYLGAKKRPRFLQSDTSSYLRLLDSHVKQAEGVEDKSSEVTEIRNELMKAEEVTVEAAQIDIAIVQEGMSPSRGQSHCVLGRICHLHFLMDHFTESGNAKWAVN